MKQETPIKEADINKPRNSFQSKKSQNSPKIYCVNESKRDGGQNSLITSKNVLIQYQVGSSALHETSQTEDEIVLKQQQIERLFIKILVIGQKGFSLQYSTMKKTQFAKHLHQVVILANRDLLIKRVSRNSFRTSYKPQFQLGIETYMRYYLNLIQVIIFLIKASKKQINLLKQNREIIRENNSFITYEDYPKYLLRSPTPLIELIRKITSDYEKFRKSYFIAYKLETSQNELQNTILKFFVTKKKQKIYLFLQFDSPTQITAAQAKQIFNQSRLINSLFTLFSASISSYLNCIITLAHIAQGDNSVDDVVYDKYFLPIQISSLQIYLTLANFRDYNLFIQNKLKLKLSTFRISEIVEETISLLNDSAAAKGVNIRVEFEVQEQFQFINSDLERKFKQILHTTIKHCLKYSKNGSIVISIQQQVTNFLQFQICNSNSNIDEKDLRQLNNNLRKYSFSSSLSIMEISQRGLIDEYPLIVANILTRKLAGTFKKGLEITKNAYTFYIESFQVQPSETNISGSHSAIKFIGDNKYLENSLSYIMAGHPSDSFQQDNPQRDSTNKQNMEHSLHFSLSQISKQMSHKYSDHQSAYFSQMSRMSKFRQDSNVSKLPISKSQLLNNSKTLKHQKSNQSQQNKSANNLSLRFLENNSQNSQSAQNLEKRGNGSNSPKQKQLMYNYIKLQDLDNGQNKSFPVDSSMKEMSKLSFSDQQVQAEIEQDKKAFFKSWRGSNQFIPSAEVDNNNNSKIEIDFDSEHRQSIHMPHGIQPKLMKNVFKYKLGSQCCSKVMVADSEYLNMQVLELVLSNYTKKIDRVFNCDDALQRIDDKMASPCKCGNKSFLLYFINLELPSKGGFFISKNIKERMLEGVLDRGFVIGNTGMIDFHTKLECYRHGMDNYLSLPLDILEIYQVLKQLSF